MTVVLPAVPTAQFGRPRTDRGQGRAFPWVIVFVTTVFFYPFFIHTVYLEYALITSHPANLPVS